MSFERYDSAGREQVLFAQEKICRLLEGCRISKKLRNVLDAFLSSLVEVLLKEQKYVGLLTLISC